MKNIIQPTRRSEKRIMVEILMGRIAALKKFSSQAVLTEGQLVKQAESHSPDGVCQSGSSSYLAFSSFSSYFAVVWPSVITYAPCSSAASRKIYNTTRLKTSSLGGIEPTTF